MDECCFQECISFYNLKNKYNPKIFRLPIFIKKDENNLLIRKNDVFNILAISRFAFPFKGYILGLINTYVKIYEYQKNISLTIVGYGQDKEQVVELINNLPKEISDTIFLQDKVPYHEINHFIRKCDVYVGMGTTILDAANLNKIVIIATAYQTFNFSDGFFHEKFNVLGTIFSWENNYFNFKDLIIEVINSTEIEFNEMSIKSKETLNKYYNIDIIANELYSYTEKYLTRFDLFYIRILRFVNNLFYVFAKIKNRMHFVK